jgi:hypothetical protein
MNLTTILKLLFSGVPPRDHIVSVDGARKGPVTEADAKVDGLSIRLRYAFQADGQTRRVEARVPLGSPGTPGGPDEIWVDGREVEGDDVILSGDVLLSGPVIKIEFNWVESGQDRRIRIDARKRWPLSG